MALQHPLVSALGTTFPAAYWRISDISLRRIPDGVTHLTARVAVYVDAAARAQVARAVESKKYSWEVPVGSTLALSDLYLYLKSLEAFEGALDV